MTVGRLRLPRGKQVVIVNCHWRPSEYGPFEIQALLRTEGKPDNLAAFEERILKFSDKARGDRGYQQTVEVVQPLLASDETVVVTGDFNEPSHLDWTRRAAREGIDRWVENPTDIPLRFPIRWRGSRLLAEAGLVDAYRRVFPDEVQRPGNTWTPPYPQNTPGRRPFADQVLDRIDMIYFAGPGLGVRSGAVIGESKETADMVFEGRWPSDHRAVLVEFNLGL